MDHDDGAGSRRSGLVKRLEVSEEGRETIFPRLHDLASTMDAYDPRSALESAEHQAYATVVSNVGNGFGSASYKIQVCDGSRVEDAKCVPSFWGTVDMAA